MSLSETIETLRPFIGVDQLACLRTLCRGEEGEYFRTKIGELAALVSSMPKTYEQEGLGDRAIIHLHYFVGGCNWYITEKDKGDNDGPGQRQAFGLADLGYGGELGYISISELLLAGVELDLYWKPITLAQLAQKKEDK
ncbi:MAG: DUF2958 domain-containing protein [Chthoniobacteraceae bacterium]|nr:DUF2958 domain-containing protein [Chthoniobacteraceae bacterium]